MKVSDIKYVRYDVDNAVSFLRGALERINAAKSPSELIAVRNDCIGLAKHIQTMASLCYIRFTLNTADEFYLAEKTYYDENMPRIAAISTELNRAFLRNPHAPKAFEQLNPNVAKVYELSLKIMDEKIVPELTEEAALVTRYDQLLSNMSFRYKGKNMPLSVLRKYFDDKDRSVRRASMEVAGKKLQSASAELQGLFTKLIDVRTRMAKKMGFSSYTEMGDCRMGRYSYGRPQIEAFRRSVTEHVVPRVCEKRRFIAEKLGFEGDIKLYDNEVCFRSGNPEPVLSANEMFTAAKEMYHGMNELTGEFIDMMLRSDAFDVFSRKGKWGGGYCTSLDDYALPFILANFNGSSGDVDVLTHEAGHALAFYYMLKNNTDYELNLGTMSVAEIHSMAMEFLAYKYTDKFFGKRAEDYKYAHLLSSLTFIPYGCLVDNFEQECYDNPDMTPDERNALWLRLESTYRPYLSSEGIPYFEKGTRWQYQMHIYENPVYYIDYCLAQSVAHQFLALSVTDYDAAFDKYMKLISHAGELSFGELLENTGLANPMNDAELKKTTDAVIKVLDGFYRES